MSVAIAPIADGDAPSGRRGSLLGAPMRLVEAAVISAAVAMPVLTWILLRRGGAVGGLLSPGSAALLLLANLVPYVALIVLIGRRIAIHRASRTGLAGGGRLHTRLVAVFSLMASVPIVLTVIAASVMFQSGVQVWGSQRARSALGSTIDLAKEGQKLVVARWTSEARNMARDLRGRFDGVPVGSGEFRDVFLAQTYLRSLYQSLVFRVADGRSVEQLYNYEAPEAPVFAQRVTGETLRRLRGQDSYTNFDATTLWVVTPLDRERNIFLYVATPNDVDFLNRQNVAASQIIDEYDGLLAGARSIQLKLNAALFGVALLIVGIATWIALAVADRLVRPVDQLVTAARRVADGDLSVRVPGPLDTDEVGTLGRAFNGMTARLEKQTGALVEANATVERRRALTEAVLAGVSAGVIAVGPDRDVRVLNSSAAAQLGRAASATIGQPLSAVVPELDSLLVSGAREGILQISVAGEPRTLAVKITRDEDGHVLTFDDITQQLLDQRRAAWSDVARRIAHEIKNPLTPIQLAAERLQRRYGKLAPEGDGTFARLTDTIVRQVGDLRRMVDEFSSFARMPKPVFREESLVDLARQAVFLHEVAHPGIRFALIYPDPLPQLVCDRRQIGQALTNLVKNAVEAVEGRSGDDLPGGEITVLIEVRDARCTAVQIVDNGVGLPVERDRIVEPYMTTRARGTGLGLAIVKKIVEEHFGTIGFTDRDGGGAVVTLLFDTATLASLAGTEPDADTPDPSPVALTRGRAALRTE